MSDQTMTYRKPSHKSSQRYDLKRLGAPCKICGWSESGAVHQPPLDRSRAAWGHIYEPETKKTK